MQRGDGLTYAHCGENRSHGKKRFNQGAGPSQRQLRVGELIRRKLSDIMLRGELHDAELAHVSVTIGEVRVSPDLRNAIVFALPLGGVNTDAVVEALNRNQGELRHLVTKGLKLKHAPELKFLADRSLIRWKQRTNCSIDQKYVRISIKTRTNRSI